MPNPTRLPLAEKIRRCIDSHPDWDANRIASAVRGSTRVAIRAVMNGLPIPEKPEPPAAKAVERSDAGTVDLSAVRKRYDIAAAIRFELSQMKPGSLILEREMCSRTAGRDASRFRRTVENGIDEFRSNRVKLRLDPDQPDGSWYWGRREDIAEALRLRDE